MAVNGMSSGSCLLLCLAWRNESEQKQPQTSPRWWVWVRAASDQSQVTQRLLLSLGMMKSGGAMAVTQKGVTECSGSAITCCVTLHGHCHAQSSSFIIFPCNVPLFLTTRCCKWLLIFINCFVVFWWGGWIPAQQSPVTVSQPCRP